MNSSKTTRRALISVALGVLGFLSPWATKSGEAAEAAVLVEVCSDRTRMIDLDLKVSGKLVEASVTCIVDGPAGPQQKTYRKNLPFVAASADLNSIYGPESQKIYEIAINVDGLSAQTVEIRRQDKQACATISAKATRKAPVPKKFIAANGKWGESVGYLVDSQCQVLAVTLGNRIAVVRAGQPVTVALYGIAFSVK